MDLGSQQTFVVLATESITYILLFSLQNIGCKGISRREPKKREWRRKHVTRQTRKQHSVLGLSLVTFVNTGYSMRQMLMFYFSLLLHKINFFQVFLSFQTKIRINLDRCSMTHFYLVWHGHGIPAAHWAGCLPLWVDVEWLTGAGGPVDGPEARSTFARLASHLSRS